MMEKWVMISPSPTYSLYGLKCYIITIASYRYFTWVRQNFCNIFVVVIGLPQREEKYVLFVAITLKQRLKSAGALNGSFIEQATVILHGMARLGRIEKAAKFKLR